MNPTTQTLTLQGVLTEGDLAQAEREFPGIMRFYAECPNKPKTFLELAFAFVRTFPDAGLQAA